MLTIALGTLRTRWTAFTGSFVALALGVAILAVMGLALSSAADAPRRAPERFAAAPVVVRGQDTLTVSTPAGVRTEPLAHPRPLPARTVAALRALGPVTEDRSFPVRAGGAPGPLVGHPWSTAAFAPYELTAGRAPRAADEVVISGTWAVVGERLRTGHGPVRVVGTVAPLGFERAVFHSDARAARLAPVSTQLVVAADPARVRRVVGDTGRVLTGDARRLADAAPDRDREAVTALYALFGTAGGVAGFVSLFVVASTFAFTVAQRRREFGLLRTAGATPGQVRRLVGAEALLVGVAASAAGCVLGAYAAPELAARVVREGLAPGWFAIGDAVWPYHLAFWTGLLVAGGGVVAASWRAGRTRPAEALREASAETGVLTRGRLLCGTALLLTAVATLVPVLLADPGELLHRKTYISRPMLLITAVALLSPALVRPLVRMVTLLPSRLPGAGGTLVRENAAAAVRRTASVAAPVLVTVALTGSLLGAVETLNRARAEERRQRTAADLVVTAGDGLDPAALRRLRAVPGAAEVSVTAPSAVYVLEEGVALVRSEARAADPAALAATARLPLTGGRVAGLDDDSIIVNEEWERHSVGRRVSLWLGDGTRRTLRIAAVMPAGTGGNGVYVTPANAPGAVPDRAEVRVAHGADRAAVAAGLREAVRSSGGRVDTAEAWLRATSPRTDGRTRAGFALILGIALLYAGITLAGTLAMAASDRRPELRSLRLAGATRAQVLRLVAAEALTVTVVGGVLGVLVAAVNLLGMDGALRLLSAPAGPVLPWPALGAVTGACAATAVVSAVVSAGPALRR
ncbi:ABC transporter permease [Streptomyces cyaneogriseus subsp. noncyanogenus]|uniref:ABC transporter permease n=1 Tax=Streptomyces cyaneogriseus subsp. noncyanogenus TaxID=477245 RepID=A0A0C5G2M4_9ACTN|nr:ABC transporter permease [Streptomyces cyaneogriseus]AJP02419.1 ABC transporter permease [Streptomyces cyaneogriseus subsp. noncyanogenus]